MVIQSLAAFRSVIRQSSLLSLSLVAVVAGCSAEKSEPASGVIPQAQLDAVEKARAVEDVLKQQDEKLRNKVDALEP